MEVFQDILNKERLERRDLELIIQKIKVYEGRLEIQLQADVDSILRSGTLPEGAAEETAVAAMAEVSEGIVNFKSGMGHISHVTIVQEAKQHPDKVFHANVISDGDPWRSIRAGRERSSSKNTPCWAEWRTSPRSCARP